MLGSLSNTMKKYKTFEEMKADTTPSKKISKEEAFKLTMDEMDFYIRLRADAKIQVKEVEWKKNISWKYL